MRDDPWHDKEEEFLSKIEKQCNLYSEYFNKDYVYYHKLSSRFNIPILVVSAINALCAISLNDFLSQRFVSILNAVLSAGTGVLGSVQLYLKLNEKMSNALRSSILMKRLALKISKELSIDRSQRATEGQAFLQECFGEFNAALEQANPIERKLTNFLAFGEAQVEQKSSMSFLNLAAALSPRRGKSIDESEIFTYPKRLQRLSEPRAKTLWGLIGKGQKDGSSPPESESPPYQTGSDHQEEFPVVKDSEP
jgi:hypothetical protein